MIEDYIDFLDYEAIQEQRDDTLGITCKYCGKDQFSWKMTEKGWRLQDQKGNIHLCKTIKVQGKNENEYERF